MMNGKIKMMILMMTSLWMSVLAFIPAIGESNVSGEIYLQYVNEIVKDFEKEAEAQLGLVCIGSGGRMPYVVEKIHIHCIAYRRATMEEARRLEVEATEMLLKKINRHEKIRPFLKEYPFKPEGAEVLIAFRKEDDSRYADGSVALIFQGRNIIFYKSDDGVSPVHKTMAEEPYEEARKIVLGSEEDHLSSCVPWLRKY